MPRQFSSMRVRLVPVFLILFIIALVSGAVWRYEIGALVVRVLDFGRCDVPRNPLSPLSRPVSVSTSSIAVRVFASYPFNNRNVLHVDHGASGRVRRAMPVFDSSEVLVGQVTEVSKEYSAVRLVGSPDWEIPVRIGTDKISGLLVGGTTVHVTMIADDAGVSPGDTVFAASVDLPYGVPIGTVESVRSDSEGGLFQDAVVRLPYSVSELTDLFISVWTPDF